MVQSVEMGFKGYGWIPTSLTTMPSESIGPAITVTDMVVAQAFMVLVKYPR